MDKSKLPKPSGLRPPQIKPLTEKQNIPGSAAKPDQKTQPTETSRFFSHRLKRRSKSVTDLRPSKERFQKTSKFNAMPFSSAKAEPTPSTSRGTVKRPAGKSDDETRAKLTKQAKIPDWDYKSRFQHLNEKHTSLLENYKSLKAKTADLEDLEERYNNLKKQHEHLEWSNLKLSSSTINLKSDNNTLKKINSDVKNQLTTVSSELKSLKTDYNDIKAKANDQATELARLGTIKSSLSEKLETIELSFSKLKTEHEALKLRNTSLNNENNKLKLDNEQLDNSLNTKLAECVKLSANLSMLQHKLVNGELLRRKLHNTIQDLKGNIRVFCRVRPPINEQEIEKVQCLLNFPDENTLEIRKSKESIISAISGKIVDGKVDFSFDRVFRPESTQEEFFEELSQLVQSALDGFDVCVFAYGQTGSGKTYTMQGEDTPEHLGMIPRSIDLIFKTIEDLRKLNWKYEVRVSFLEIYNECVRDLSDPDVNRSSLEIHYNEGRGITVQNLKIHVINSPEEFDKLIKIAQKNRMVAATNFNEHSSRSHAVYKIYLYGSNDEIKCSNTGSVNLVDLAGSERAKTSTGERLVETRSINSSLSALGSVMLALFNKEKYIPYRNSKLTYLLQSSLGGNSKTLMVVNISPFEEYYQESVTSLRFASKVKEVRTVVKRHKTILPHASTSGIK